MSTYYLLVNEDKKEYIWSGDLDLDLRLHAYRYHISKLVGYLVMKEKVFNCVKEEQYDPYDDELGDRYFEGHWHDDNNIHLVSEHTDLYEIIRYEQPDQPDWVNITKPLAREWNKRIQDCYQMSPNMDRYLETHIFNIK